MAQRSRTNSPYLSFSTSQHHHGPRWTGLMMILLIILYFGYIVPGPGVEAFLSLAATSQSRTTARSRTPSPRSSLVVSRLTNNSVGISHPSRLLYSLSGGRRRVGREGTSISRAALNADDTSFSGELGGVVDDAGPDDDVLDSFGGRSRGGPGRRGTSSWIRRTKGRTSMGRESTTTTTTALCMSSKGRRISRNNNNNGNGQASSSGPQKNDPDLEDVPDDWTEDDLLAEFDPAEFATVVGGGGRGGLPVDDDPGLVVVGEEDEDLTELGRPDIIDEDDEGFSLRSTGKKGTRPRSMVDDDDDDEDDDLDLDEIDEEVIQALGEDEEDEEGELEDFDAQDGVLQEEIYGQSNRGSYADEEEGNDGSWQEFSSGTGKESDEWDEEEDGGEYELIDDPDDPNYMRQKELVEEAAQAAEGRALDEEFDPIEFFSNHEISEEQKVSLEQLPFFRQVEAAARGMLLTEQDVAGMDVERQAWSAPDPMYDDPYPRHSANEENFLQDKAGLTDDDMEELDATFKDVRQLLNREPWDKVMVKDMTGWDNLSNKTIEEMEACLEELGGSAYNVTKWLLYDLDFNVSNLILAAIKHNREAPILFQHWYPQLVTYDRYRHAQDRNFDFTWSDVEKADISELERYYAGFGYDKIPLKAPSETGIISLEELDEEEIRMVAFENWIKDVYNPEWDKKDFDDDDIQDEDNVFSDFYEAPQHPDLPAFGDAADDIEAWREEMGDDPSIQEYRDMMGQKFEYTVVKDEEFEREFRGHLIIACTCLDEDISMAEKITQRFDKEFGKKVFVETRAMALARREDNVFEVWLESYEIDLLHSKKRATSNAKGWNGPAECDDAQIDHLVDRVRFLISDEARYSYRFFAEAGI